MDGIFSADFLFSVEKKMKVLNELGYAKMLASKNIWWPKLLRTVPLESKSERFIWLLDTASIEQLSPNDGGEVAGQLNFDELATIMQEYAPAYHARGFKIGKMRMLNMMNGGLDPAGRWARAVGIYGAYYPQRLLAQVILNGGATIGYDGVNFFSTSHPVHPLIPALGSYANDFTGAPSGSYPGACPIDDSVSLDTAFINFSKVLAYITGAIPQPNGAGDPRFLEVAYVLHPPRMAAQVHQLFRAETIAKLAGTSGNAGGGSDVRDIWEKFMLAEPIEAKEIGGATTYTFMGPNGAPVTVTGDDKTYYVVCKEAEETELGAFLQNLRMPFTMHTYSGDSGTAGIDAVLGRSQDLEWHYDGWTAVNPGHPYTVFRCRGT